MPMAEQPLKYVISEAEFQRQQKRKGEDARTPSPSHRFRYSFTGGGCQKAKKVFQNLLLPGRAHPVDTFVKCSAGQCAVAAQLHNSRVGEATFKM